MCRQKADPGSLCTFQLTFCCDPQTAGEKIKSIKREHLALCLQAVGAQRTWPQHFLLS